MAHRGCPVTRWRRLPRGVRRVRHDELIRLLQGALRSADLEAQIREQTLREKRALAERRAHVLAEAWLPQGVDAATARACVAGELPLTTDGTLHEAAFLALLEARWWAVCARPLAPVRDLRSGRA